MSDIEDRLHHAESPATPPSVGHLRKALADRRHRRRRRRGAVAALGLAGLAVATVAFLDGRPGDERITAGPATSVDASSTTALPTTTAGADASSSTTETIAGAGSDWSILLPGPDWDTDFLVEPRSTQGATTYAFAATPADGPFGPMTYVSFHAGAAPASFASPPGSDVVYEERTTPAGAAAFVGGNVNLADLGGFVGVEGGTAWVQSIGLSEDELLSLLDRVTVTDGLVMFTDDELPAGLVPTDGADIQPDWFDVGILAQGEEYGAGITVIEAPFGWHLSLFQRAQQPDVEPITVGDHRAMIPAPSGGTQLTIPTALLATPDHVYEISLYPHDLDDEPATREDMRAFLDDLEERTASEVIAELDMSLRAEVYGEWLAAIPLPPDHGLEWLLDGPPPADPEREARRAHGEFTCAWARYWEETGDEAALDAIAANDDWPTAALVGGEDRNDWFEIFKERTSDNAIDEARQLTTEAERSASELATGC